MPLPAVTPEEIDSYVTSWKKANEEERVELEERRNKAKQIAQETALRLGTAGIGPKRGRIFRKQILKYRLWILLINRHPFVIK